MNLIQQYNNKKISELIKQREVVNFKAGDTIKVHLKILEGNTERVQVFEGVCIAKTNKSIGSTFTVRKISYNEGVERLFYLYSPRIQKIDVQRVGKVRRAKLYYLRELKGKAARIAEDNSKSLITKRQRNNEKTHTIE